MAYVRVLGGLAVLGGGCLAYAVAQSHHVRVAPYLPLLCTKKRNSIMTSYANFIFRVLQLSIMT